MTKTRVHRAGDVPGTPNLIWTHCVDAACGSQHSSYAMQL